MKRSSLSDEEWKTLHADLSGKFLFFFLFSLYLFFVCGNALTLCRNTQKTLFRNARECY